MDGVKADGRKPKGYFSLLLSAIGCQLKTPNMDGLKVESRLPKAQEVIFTSAIGNRLSAIGSCLRWFESRLPTAESKLILQHFIFIAALQSEVYYPASSQNFFRFDSQFSSFYNGFVNVVVKWHIVTQFAFKNTSEFRR